MIYLLVFLSGFCALIYQVLWMKQLGLLFGNTSHAAGTTLAAFFTGLALGSYYWGKKSATSKNQLRTYSYLEIGVALTALIYFIIHWGYLSIYPLVFQNLNSAPLLIAVKFLLALILIFPPAFCMGGTIPIIGQHAIKNPSQFGSKSALLYGVNTLGATLGALLAGFFMPLWFGFQLTCIIAIAITCFIAAIAFFISRNTNERKSPVHEASTVNPSTEHNATQPLKQKNKISLALVCFISGFGVLALEVLWTRMFALILENSVYTFAAILVVVLLCLAGGAVISSILARRSWQPSTVLTTLLILSGLAIALTPNAYMHLTDSFQFQSPRETWANFVLFIFKKCTLIIGPPALLLGTIFPYLLKTQETHTKSPGKTLGKLATINTIGAVIGSITCAFLLLEIFGLWQSMQIISAIYFLIALTISTNNKHTNIITKAASIAGITLLFTTLNPTHLPTTGITEEAQNHTILKTWEGSDCTVSVIRDNNGISIKINSDYGLGSTNGRIRQACQAEIPLMLKPDTKSVFFLGMGTGVSAGAALSDKFPNIEQVITCELSPHVIEASKEFITNVNGSDLTQGLFSDPRSKVLAEDGRHYLMATKEKFDMINADLFVPFRSGAGSLYTKEHFQNVNQRLNENGIFVQWLPTYQVTEFEFHVIGKTMLQVFDQVSLIRCDFESFNEIVAFVGHKNNTPLPRCDIDDSQIKTKFLRSNGKDDIYSTLNPQTALIYYAGNISEAKDKFEKYPINTDDKPIIEYMSPRQYRNTGEDKTPWFVGPFLLKFIKDLQENCPPEKDPILKNRAPSNILLPRAGNAFQETKLWAHFGNNTETQRSWKEFTINWINNTKE